jgi:hypothetical protein
VGCGLAMTSMMNRLARFALVGLLWTGWAGAQTVPEATATGNPDYVRSLNALPPGAELPYEEGLPIPPGYDLVSRPRHGLVVAGSILVGVLWTLGIMAATKENFGDQLGFLLVPGIGPWLTLAAGGGKPSYTEKCIADVCEGQRRVDLRPALVVDGIGQTVGAALLVSGLVFPIRHLVQSGVTMSMAPMPIREGGYGLRLVGNF